MTEPTFPAKAEDKTSQKVSKTPEQKAAKKKAKRDAATKQKADETKKAKSGNVLHTVSAQGGYELHLCEDGEWRTNDDLFNLTKDN